MSVIDQTLARRLLPHMERSLARTVKNRDKALGKPVHAHMVAKAEEKLGLVKQLREIAGIE